MEKVAHWTQGSDANFVYSISSFFTNQLEMRMEEKQISRSELAGILKKSPGRISQVFNDPGNLSLSLVVEYARALGMKVSLVAYDDNDPKNNDGPMNPDVFVKCWEQLNRPADLFEIERKAEATFVPENVVHANEVVGGLVFVNEPFYQTGGIVTSSSLANALGTTKTGDRKHVASPAIHTIPPQGEKEVAA